MPSDYDPGADASRLVTAAEASVRALHPVLACSGVVVQGPPPVVLVDASRRARLLVVGSRGHGELAGMVIGSVSQHCVTHAHCPVVVVRGEIEHQDAQGQAGRGTPG